MHSRCKLGRSKLVINFFGVIDCVNIYCDKKGPSKRISLNCRRVKLPFTQSTHYAVVFATAVS